MSNPRFVIEMQIRDQMGPDCYVLCIGCDEALRISSRDVGAMKTGDLRFTSLDPMRDTIPMMRAREMRRRILIQTAMQLANQMADRMEDAEGWHDPERIEPARQSLGGGSWA